MAKRDVGVSKKRRLVEPPGVDLFEPAEEQTTIEDSSYIEIFPLNALQRSDPIIFHFESDQKHCLDLSRTKLYVQFKLTVANGGDLANNVRVATVNYPLASLFRRFELYLNSTKVEDQFDYPAKAYLEILLSEDRSVKEEYLQAGLFALDDPNQFENTVVVHAPNTDRNSGFVTRQAFTDQSASVDLLGKIHLDIFKSRRLFPPGVNVKLIAYPAPDAYVLLAHAGANTTKLQINSTSLFLRQVLLNPDGHKKMMSQLQRHNAIYPFPRSYITTRNIANGSRVFRAENFLNGQTLPDAIIIGFIKTASFHGTITTNPFNFEKFGLNKLVLHVNNQRLPRQSGTDDIDLWRFISNYDKRGSSLGISRQGFATGYYLTRFQLTDLSANIVSRSKSGRIDVEGSFSADLGQAVTMVAFLEYYNESLELNRFLQPAVSSI